MSESVIFEAGSVEITRSVARFGKTSYPIANIGSVTIDLPPPPKEVTLFGRIALYFMCFVFVAIGALMIYSGVMWGWALVLLFGAMFFVKPEAPAKEGKLFIRTSSGNEQAFASKDLQLVRNVHDAIQSAIALR
jgi:hypothetical protein